MANKGISIIVPSYTGEEYIQQCLESIMTQMPPQSEVVVVIDGPNESLRDIVNTQEKVFNKHNLTLKIHQFKTNKGRFTARYRGAKLAQYPNLLFIDDRITLDDGFFKKIKNEEKVTIPNALEAYHPNLLSRLLYLFRKKIYGKQKWGSDFKNYHITKENFENSPKGTTSLWVTKDVFLKACDIMQEQYSDAASIKLSNDDTKLLRIIIEITRSIYRRSDLKIYYHPRSSFMNELRHIYHRGPPFVDYYLRPGTRFFKYILCISAVFVTVLSCALLYPESLPYFIGGVAAGILLISMYIAETVKDVAMSLLLIPLVTTIFCLGVAKGLFKKLYKPANLKAKD